MNDDQVKHLLKTVFPKIGDAQPNRDLWPAMRQRLDQETVRVTLFDWALMAAVFAWVVIYPQGALTLFYHL